MRRRIVWSAAALAVLLSLVAAPASAAEYSRVTPDGDVTEPTGIEVHLERRFAGEPLRRALVSLQLDGERVGAAVDLECDRGCGDRGDRAVFVLPDGAEFDPHTGAPFGADAPLPNGTYGLKVEVHRGNVFDDLTFDDEVHVAVPPRAPEGLQATVDAGEVELTWDEAVEPDVERHRVERHDGDEWVRLDATTSTSYVDEPGEGEHRYRVVAERLDGRDGRLETASGERTVDVDAQGNGGERDDDGNGNGNGEDEGDGNGNGEDDGGDGNDERADAASSSSDTDRRSRNPASAPDVGGRSGSIPGVGARGMGEEGYAGELDYGERGAGDEADDVLIANQSGWRGTVDEVLDGERLAVPLAAGLLMTATGLHLWRWLRVPMP